MTDEKKEDSKEEKKTFLKLAEENKLTKFKTEEDLIKAYKDLEKNYSSRIPNKEDDEEQVLSKFAEFFAKTPQGTSRLSDDLGGISKKIGKDSKLPASIADSVVAQAAGHVSSLITNSNRKAVSKVMQDPEKIRAIERALKDDAAIKSFQNRYNDGNVTKREAELLAQLGAEAGDNPKGIGSTASPVTGGADRLMEILSDPMHPYHDSRSIHHKDAVLEVKRLKERQ